MCILKFGGWTNNGLYMDMLQIKPHPEDNITIEVDEIGTEYEHLERGMGLAFFQEFVTSLLFPQLIPIVFSTIVGIIIKSIHNFRSAEWDLMRATSGRYEASYPGCCGQQFYIDIKFKITLRRKALFFTVNLVIPCILIGNFRFTYIPYIK
jgi:hypothetical protein